jgi:flagellar protein FlgJ
MGDQQSYTDLNSLQQLKQIGKEDKSAALREIAQQFESLFLNMMLKSMHSANSVFAKDNPLNSFEMQHHQEMYNKQLALSLSQSNNMGLADSFYRQMKNAYLSTTAKLPSNIENEQVYFKSDSIHSIAKNRAQGLFDEDVLNSLKAPQDYIDALTPYAKKAAKQIGVDHRVLIAQSALETGWGEHIIRDKNGDSSFNLFNIKADRLWPGKSVSVRTLEYVDGIARRETANFRRYSSIEESFSDYQKFISQPRYANALIHKDKPQVFVQELQQAGYATDPKYAEKITSILNNETLWLRN